MTLKEKENLIAQFVVFVNNIPSECDVQIPIGTKDERIELLTIKECVKEIEGLTECTLRQLIAQDKLPYIRTGAGKRGKILVPKTALLKYFGE